MEHRGNEVEVDLFARKLAPTAFSAGELLLWSDQRTLAVDARKFEDFLSFRMYSSIVVFEGLAVVRASSRSPLPLFDN